MTGTLQVDPSNASQAQAWDGDEGAYWAQNADQFDLSVRGYRAPFFEAAAIGAADRVLDIGCGTGETTRSAARLALAGRALGVDLSADMVEIARRRAAAEQVDNAVFEQADAQVFAFPGGTFDVAISRTGSMFFADPPAAFRNIGHALRRRGRLVQLVWQAPPRNEWFVALTTALAAGRALPAPPPEAPGPFALADPSRVRNLLTDAGFAEPSIDEVTAPMHFGADADDAYRFVTGLLGWMLEDLGDSGRERALADLRATIESHRTPDGVLYASSAWLITTTRS